MTVDSAVAPVEPMSRRLEQGPRLRVPLGLVAAYWACIGVTRVVEIATFYRFITHSVALLVVILVFLVWWGFNRRVAVRDRLYVLAAAVAAPVVAMLLAHETMGPFPLFNGLPVLFTAWAVWLVLARHASDGVWRSGLIAVLFLSVGVFTLFRMEGLDGAGAADMKWRWSATPEERYLAQRPAAAASNALPTAVVVREGDWPGFRGARRDAVVRGMTLATDWTASPPRQVWRRAIGPGWSSMSVVGGRVFTQEQRGENEAVVCLDAETGSELWSHQEPGRFWDSLSSTGPRATPTFDGGRIYAQGATGTLLCLDAASGAKLWSRNVLEDANGKVPDWGVSASPLITHGLAIVYAAGQGGKGLLAYRVENGELVWTADAGIYSYASPHLLTIGGREQVLFMSDKGLIAVDPKSGKTIWEYAAQGQPPRSLQPLLVGETRLLLSTGMEAATELLDVAPAGDGFAASRAWTSRHIKPSFNDFVVHGGNLYGFDVRIFTCVDLVTGKRTWKEGRYGTGQVVLLADQGALLVLSDQGQVVLLAARPDAFEELGQFQAINGKTWNHPALAGGRLYVRNSEEMACYALVGEASGR
jgi:outer membrane protein assembly factor BamB